MSLKATRTRYKHNTHNAQCMFLKRNNRVHVTGEKNAYRLLYDSPVQTSTRTLHIAYAQELSNLLSIFTLH